MNRNYKVVWNEASRCFVAVAEYAKSRGKTSGTVMSRHTDKVGSASQVSRVFELKTLRSGLLALGFTSLALGMSSQVSAAVGVNGGTGNGTAVSKCVNSNPANSGSNSENIAIGCDAETSNTGLRIADRGNPYYTNKTTSVAASEQNAYTPSGKEGGAVAIGTGATTEKTFGVALGDYAKTTEIAGVAIGIGSLSKGNTALAIGRQSAAIADYSQAIGNVAAATGKGSLAVGHSAAATGYRAIAIGATDINSATDSFGQPNANYHAAGQTKASADDTIAFGSGAQASANTAVAIGTSSTATRVGSVALGSGANTVTAANGVTNATVDGRRFGNFAGSTNIDAGDQISVGAVGAERQIKNVAAGNVTAVSTDAINGSQLFSVTNTLGQDITNNTVSLNQGLNFAGDNTLVNINRKFGQKLSVKGGEDDESNLTDNNIGVIADDVDGSLTVKLAKDIVLGAEGSVQTGNTLMNNEGVILTGGTNQIIRLSNNGLDNGGNRIVNVAQGTVGTDAVNLDQLNAVKNSAENANQGFNISAQDGNTSNVKPGDTVNLKNNDGNITVSKETGSNDVSFDLNKDVKLDSATFGDVVISNNGLNNGGNKITNVGNGTIEADSKDAINGGQLNATVDSMTTVIGGNAVNNNGVITTTDIGGTGENTIDGAIGAIQQGVTNTNAQVTTNTTNIANNTNNIANNTTNIQANTDRLDDGLNFGADSGNVINKPIGDPNALRFQGGNNITTTSNGVNNIKFDLNGDISLDSVKTGNTTTNNNGVTVTGGPNNDVVLGKNGLNNGGNTITNVADGVNNNDAVNVGQLNALDNAISSEMVTIDRNMNDLGYRIDEVEDEANAGISAAMAMASLPQAFIPGKSMVGGGIASYNGESAVAVGVSKVSDNGRWVFKVNGSADTQGNAGGSVGAGLHF